MKSFSTFSLILLLSFLFACEDNIKHEVPTDEIKDVKYSEVQKIFTDNCVSCHNTATAGTDLYARLDLQTDSYSKIFEVSSTQQPDELLIVPNSPEESYLYRKITNAEGITGTVMPQEGKMAQQNIDKIKVWIEEGALNN